ncbi:ribonuclease H-like domain-containing protein [Tanacetum coccineum]
MDQDSAHMMAASKVPMLKYGEYEIWRMRIEQYIQMLDYALWEDAKKLLEAVEKRFGRNEAIKKTQRNLLKQQYENFTAPSSEMLDQTFNRLQKLVSQLEFLGEKISQEDVNKNMDDLYNNFKVYEPNSYKMSSQGSSTQNMAFVSSSNNNTSSTNEAINTAHEVSTASTRVNAANSTNIDNLSDVVICSFFASQPNSSQLVHEDLQQIHPDDIEEMDLRWRMAMLTMRAKRIKEVLDSGCSRQPDRVHVPILLTMKILMEDMLLLEETLKEGKSQEKDHLGKFDGKADEGFFVGYSLNSKAFRVFNSKTRIVEENLHIRFSESTPNVVGSGLDWLFDIDALTRTMNYEPIVAGTQSNGFAGTKASDNVGQARKETEPVKDYILLPLWTADPSYSQDPKSSHDDGSKHSSDDRKKNDEDPRKDSVDV